MRIRLDQTTEAFVSFGLCKHEIPICLYGTSFASVHVSEVLQSIESYPTHERERERDHHTVANETRP